jgi:hypothetical protein
MAPNLHDDGTVGNNPLTDTSYTNVRTVVASLVTVVLLSLLAVCPLTACSLLPDNDAARHSCCHKPTHCPLPTVQDCPYFILEKGKITQTAAPVSVHFFQVVTPDVRVPDQFSSLRGETRLPDSEGLYLRVRVLLI